MISNRLKIYFSVICFSIMCMNVYAQQNTLEKAQSIASLFFEQSGPSARTMYGKSGFNSRPTAIGSSFSLKKSSRNNSITFSAEDEPTFYVFANPHGKGFAIVSGDDVAKPLIGYSFDNNASDFDKLPENINEYLLGVDEQIKRLRSSAYKVGPTNEITKTGNVKVLLNTAEWGQGDPFNRDCYNPQGEKCITGCVPTAFAILLRYHEWPLSGSGMVNNNGQWGTTQRDISNNVYRWSEMPLSYVQYTDEQAGQVAQLMYDLGCACLVDYGTRETGGNISTSMMKAVEEHFGYKNGKFEKKDLGSYTDEQWCAAIRNDLDEGRPIPYAATRVGASTAPDAKHMFVIDGYTDNDYYHFNWGWNGSCNGYYTLADMTPNTNGTYSNNHIAIFNFTPDRKESYTISVAAQGNGTVYIGDDYTCNSRKAVKGSVLELHAIANAEYEFANWTVNGAVVSQTKDYSITVNEDVLYTANFVKTGEVAAGTWYYVKFKNYDKYLTAENIGAGLTASEKQGDNNPAQLWQFIEKSGKYEIHNQKNIYLCINSSVSGSRNSKSETADVYLGYTPTEKIFKKEKWNRNGGGERIFFYGEINDFPLSLMSDNHVILVKSNEEDNINVVLEKAELIPENPPVTVRHKVTLTGNAGTRVIMTVDGNIAASGVEVAEGSDVVLTFTLNTSEEAVVTVGSNDPVVVTGTSYTVKNIKEDININADICKKPEPKVTISVKSNNEEWGYVYVGNSKTTTSVSVNKGEMVIIHAVDKDGVFTGWTCNQNTLVITDKDYTFKAENNVEYVAGFKEPEVKMFPVNLTTNCGTKVSMFVDGTFFAGGDVKAGSDVVLRFSMGTGEKALVSVNNEKMAEVTGTSYTIKNVQCALNIDVQIQTYELVNVSVISGANGTAYIQGTDDKCITVERGSEVTINAVADGGYIFDSWSVNGVSVSNMSLFKFKADKDIEYTANFKEETVDVSNIYYTIRFCERGGVLTAQNDGTVTASNDNYTSQDDQLWLFIPTASDNSKYYVCSKSGRYLKLSELMGDAAINTTDINEADVFSYMFTKDYDRWQQPAYEDSYLLVKDHEQRYCIEESSETPGKVIGCNQPCKYTELMLEPHTITSIDNHEYKESIIVTDISGNMLYEDGAVYNLYGCKVDVLVPGRTYVKNGVKFIAR